MYIYIETYLIGINLIISPLKGHGFLRSMRYIDSLETLDAGKIQRVAGFIPKSWEEKRIHHVVLYF